MAVVQICRRVRSKTVKHRSKAEKLATIKGLSGLAGLPGLQFRETPPVSEADVAKCAQQALDVQKTTDIVRVSRETKGRGGKAVTLVKGISLADKDLDTLGKLLKTACGSGGTVKDAVIEVQGDHVDRVVALLVGQGYKAKRAGG
jgi:translation initiation factor 1